MLLSMNVPATSATLTAAMQGLTALNYIILGRRKLPPIYQSGVRYVREPPGREHWLRADEVYEDGEGDCEDLATWRAAELRRKGIPAMAIAKRSGRRKFHAIVVFPDGTIEDPSRRLGMKGKG